MNYEFTKLGAVEALTEMPENANALVEVGGAIKRVPASALGGSSAPAEVVILPETELTMLNDMGGSGGQYMLSTPFATKPTVGGTYKLMWGGMEYTSKAVDMSALVEQGMPPCMVLGNVAITGVVEGVENPDPSAPYAMMIYKDGISDGDQTAYAVMVSVGITPEPPVLSIVQTDAGSTSGSEGMFIVNATPTKVDGSASATFDKTYVETLAAIRAGKQVVMWFMHESETKVMQPMAFSDEYMLFGCVAYLMGLSAESILWNSNGTVSVMTMDD